MDEKLLESIRDEPRLLGRLLGYTKLLPLHDQWIRDCWDEKKLSCIMAYRGSYKTTSVIICGIIRYLLFFPETRIILIRKTFTDAAKVTGAVSGCFDKPELQALFHKIHGITPRKTIDGGGRLEFNFKSAKTPEANVNAYGIGASITGAHADVIIADDIVTDKDRISRAEREKTKEYIYEVLTNIADTQSVKIICGTPWHRDDAFSEIAEMCEIKKYPIEKFNMLSPEEEAEKRKTTNPFLWACNYSLEFISDETQIFRDPVYGPFDLELWRSGPVAAHIDAAYGGQDTCALTVMSGCHAVGWLFDGNITDWYSFIEDKYKLYRCSKILTETNADRGFLARELRSRGLRAETYTESMNKDFKISSYLYKYWKDLIWDNSTDTDYMLQIIDWRPHGTGHDDAPDSASCLLRYFHGGGSGVFSGDVKRFFFGG
jgi:hypothetical protein